MVVERMKDQKTVRSLHALRRYALSNVRTVRRTAICQPSQSGEAPMALQRSRDNQLLGGVCAGIARELGWDITLVRLGYVLLSFFSAAFPGLLVYIILWIIMPLDKGRQSQ
jgi:phage shock protein C